jgi:hypothetical protein
MDTKMSAPIEHSRITHALTRKVAVFPAFWKADAKCGQRRQGGRKALFAP